MQQNIYLIGFMGTGKSTISHSLATILKYEEIDTDLWITQQQGKSVTEIFELYGEQYFRDLETECLKQMKMEHHKIISCGIEKRKYNFNERKWCSSIIDCNT